MSGHCKYCFVKLEVSIPRIARLHRKRYHWRLVSAMKHSFSRQRSTVVSIPRKLAGQEIGRRCCWLIPCSSGVALLWSVGV